MAKASHVDLRDFGTTCKAYRAEILKDINLYGVAHLFHPGAGRALWRAYCRGSDP